MASFILNLNLLKVQIMHGHWRAYRKFTFPADMTVKQMFTMWKIIPMERGQNKKKQLDFQNMRGWTHGRQMWVCESVCACVYMCLPHRSSVYWGIRNGSAHIGLDASLFPDFNHNRFLNHMWIKNNTMCHFFCLNIFSFKTIRKFLYFCSMYWIWWRNYTTILGQKVFFLINTFGNTLCRRSILDIQINFATTCQLYSISRLSTLCKYKSTYSTNPNTNT